MSFNPDYVVAPAETLKDWMEAESISVEEFARRCSLDLRRLEQILDPSRSSGRIATTTACKLYQGTGISARFWLRREHQFREGLEQGKIWVGEHDTFGQFWTEADRVRTIIKVVGVPSLLNGSGVMTMHGITRTPKDVDLFVPVEHWFGLYHNGSWEMLAHGGDHPDRFDPPILQREIHGLTVHAFCAWRTRELEGGNVDLNREWHRAEIVDGVRCLALWRLYEWKAQQMREKDRDDLALIGAHFDICEKRCRA